MEKITGIVTSVSQKDGKYGFTIGKNNWYNGFGECPCKKGEKIEVSYEVNGTFKNIDKVTVLEKAAEKSEIQYGRDPEVIVRTDCYRMAVDLHIADNQVDISQTAEDLFNKIMNK